MHIRIIRERRTVDITAYIAGRIKIPSARRSRGADGKAFIIQTGFAHFATIVMVVEFFCPAIIEQYLSVGIDNGDTQFFLWNIFDKLPYRLINVSILLGTAK